ncbi:MAG TPA: RNA polymerase sigma factor [Fimbriimonadales bacterium]|jgi:RNA polymerase sigma-70 factor (ECF subfamily)|nr:RNA polymerase sigma factor [Fimbriimonadales bacterium]
MNTELIHSERDLVEKAAKGCRRSFDELVDRHYQGVYAHAYRIMRNHDDAADATQTAFVKAYRSLKEFDVTRPLRPWLYRICGNVCIDMARSRHRSDEDLEKHAYMLESPETPERNLEKSDLEKKIRKAISNLPERYRRIVLLRHYQQLDVEEIADMVGAPEGTIKSWLFRARALLKSELSPLIEQGLAEASV